MQSCSAYALHLVGSSCCMRLTLTLTRKLSLRSTTTTTTITTTTSATRDPLTLRVRSSRSSDGYEEEAEAQVDHYKVLGVPRGATREEIKRAYRLLALKHHPDVSASSTHLFVSISAAYHVLSNENTRAEYDLRTQFCRKSYKPNPAMSAKHNYYSYPDPIRYYRWTNFKKRTTYQRRHTKNPYREAVEQDGALDANRETFSNVLRFTFFALFLVKILGHFGALTVCALLPLLDDELDNGYKLGYLISWLLGGMTGVILMLFVRFSTWLCGKRNSGRLMLVVLAMWVGVSLARFAPLPQGAVLAMLYMSMKLHDDLQ